MGRILVTGAAGKTGLAVADVAEVAAQVLTSRGINMLSMNWPAHLAWRRRKWPRQLARYGGGVCRRMGRFASQRVNSRRHTVLLPLVGVFPLSRLNAPKRRVQVVILQELLVATLFLQATIFQHEDLIGVAYR